MKSGSVIALLVLVAVIAAGMVWLAETPASDQTGAIAPVNTSESAPTEDGPAELGPTEVGAGEGLDLGTGRATAPPVEIERSSGTLLVFATDAITGRPVSRFWMKPDAMVDLAAASPPLLSDVKTGAITLPHTLWDGGTQGEALSFLVSSPRHTPMGLPLDRPRRSGEERKLELQRAASIIGVVRDGSSAPLASARVTLKYHGPVLEFTGELGEPLPLPDAYQGPTLRLTDAAGEYGFSQLPPGVYRTHVQQASALHASDPITVRPGEWALGDHWLDEHVRLIVTVLKADGTTAESSRILLAEVSPPLNASLGDDVEIISSQYTDAEGRATLGPLSPGAYGVYIQSDDGVAAPMALDVAETSRSVLELSAHLEPAEER